MSPYLKSISRKFKKLLQTDNINQGKNNLIKISKNYSNVKWDINGDNNVVEIAENTIIKNVFIYIKGNNNRIIIHENCFIAAGELWIEDDNCSLIIHTKTTIEQAHLAVTENFSILEIMEDCMLAKNIDIRTGDSHSIIDMVTGKRINKAANVKLMPHVWVGDGVKILKGVVIGSNSIIATGAVVTKDIEANSIAAGIPAMVIKNNIDWKRERLTS